MRALRIEPVGELGSVVGLDAFDGKREAFHAVLDEFRGRIGAVFFEGFQITKATVFVDEGVLVIITAVFLGLFGGSADQTGAGDVFDVDLHFLSGIICLFIRLGDIFGIWQLYGHLSSFPQQPI